MRLELHGDIHIHMHNHADQATEGMLNKIFDNTIINQKLLHKMADEIKDLKQQLLDQGLQLDAIQESQDEQTESLVKVGGDLKTLNDKITALGTGAGQQGNGNIVVLAADFADLKATADATSAKFAAVVAKAKANATQAAALDAETPAPTVEPPVGPTEPTEPTQPEEPATETPA